MSRPQLLLILAASLCCLSLTAAQRSAAGQALDESMKGQVEAMAQVPKAAEDPGTNYQIVCFEAGLIAIGLVVLRSYAIRFGRRANAERGREKQGSAKEDAPCQGRTFAEFAAEFRAGPGGNQGGLAEANARFLARAPMDLELAQQFLSEVARSSEAAAQRKLFVGLLA